MYYDGFRGMTLGKKLWILIICKLIFIFVIMKIFFFPDMLQKKSEQLNTTKSEAVRKLLQER